ncbi:toxin HicA [Nocardia farcinica]|uniref:toxin HicA n=1 Tax=Nocardia farcinica TaxID=37329 RepID=UPI001895EBA5|nr:toxin HicA [Nocardia farcinica]MBF6189506.1 toxin HicA [Nocardia farcinica]
MAKAEKLLAKMRESPTNLRYTELHAICVAMFGLPRMEGTSHAVFQVPWPGDPRVNIQEAKNGGCKMYQVKQVIAAVDKLQQMQAEEGD